MLTFEEARTIAAKFIHALERNQNDSFEIVDSATRAESFGWVFFWNSQRYIETKDWHFQLFGNVPVVVLRETGHVQFLPRASSSGKLDKCIQAFAASLPKP
jgi:hypothetical protein